MSIHEPGAISPFHQITRLVAESDSATALTEPLASLLRALMIESGRVESSLRESEERHRLLFENNPEAVIVSDAETLRIQDVNDAAVRQYGYSREEFLRLGLDDLRPREWATELRRRLSEHTTGVLRTGPWPHRRKDGTLFEAEVAAHLVPVGGRRVWVGVVIDVTERTRAQRALIAREAELRTLLEHTPDLVERFDPDLRGTYGNAALERASGVPLFHIVGRRPSERPLSPEAALAWESALRGVFATGQPASFEFGAQGPDGPRHYECRLIPERVPGGAVASTLAVSRDVTERRSLEAQLQQAQKMEAVGRLAGGVAHDFNNLLGVITGYTDLLLAKLQSPEPARARLTEIRKAAHRAAALTRQLLAFSRKQVVELRPLDLNAILEDVEKMLRRLIGEDIDLRTVLAADLGCVKADAGQIEQVVMNLAVNARDAMPEGGKLTVETRNVMLDEAYARAHLGVRSGSYVLLAVSDTGVGIDARTRAHLFEPFFTTKEKGKGTGLGLATVYGIVKQSGGHVAVYSEPGLGSSFKVYLPRLDAPAAGPPVAEAPEPDLQTGTETILLVEDDDGVRGLLTECLASLGYAVLAAASPEPALAMARSAGGAIDLLLTDVVMPGMSGCQLAALLSDGSRPPRVLYMSGYTDDAILHHGLLEPGLDFLQKPFAPAALARKVREVLSRPAARADAANVGGAHNALTP